MLKKDRLEEKQSLNVGFKAIEGSFLTKEENGNEYGYFEGYASTFDDVDRGRDMVVQGAFLKSINDGATVQILWQHDRKEVLGSYTKLKEDKKGLYVKGRLNLAVLRAKEAYALLKAGDIDSMSIGYFLKKYEVVRDDSGEVECWKLTELELSEISLVCEPMNTNASITNVKSDFKQNNKKEGLKMSAKKEDEKTKTISGLEVATMVAEHKTEIKGLNKSFEKKIGDFETEVKTLKDSVLTKDAEILEKATKIEELTKEVEIAKKEKETTEAKKSFSEKYPNFKGETLDEKFNSLQEVKNAGLDKVAVSMEESYKKENGFLTSGNPLFSAKGSLGDSVNGEYTDDKVDSMIAAYKKENKCSHLEATEAVAEIIKPTK